MSLKNITFSADEHLLNAAHEKAQRQQTNLNAEFQRWLVRYTTQTNESEPKGSIQDFNALIDQLSTQIQFDRTYTRDELNAR